MATISDETIAEVGRVGERHREQQRADHEVAEELAREEARVRAAVSDERAHMRLLFDTYAAGLSGRNSDAAIELRKAVDFVFNKTRTAVST